MTDKKLRVWLDDVRPMPENFDIWVKTELDAILLIGQNKVSHLSFDHDLGENAGNGYNVAACIEHGAYYNKTQSFTWDVHSQNPVGRKNIEACMKQAERFWNFKPSDFAVL